MVMVSLSPRLSLSAFFQPILSIITAQTVQWFEGFPVPSHYLVCWGKIFQVLEAEAL